MKDKVTRRLLLILALLCVGLFGAPGQAADLVYYFHNDHLGTPQAMSDASGRKVWVAEYEPFGKATVNQDPDGDGQVVVNNLRFPGQYYDAETGLHYNYHRDYDPSTGRYLQPDPIGLEGGPNLYSYVLNDPIGITDPEGLDPQVPSEEGGHFWDVNPVTQCHFNPKRDPCENLTEGMIIAGGLMGLVCPNPWMGKIALHGPHGTHPYDHIQFMLRTGLRTT
jgi:RHS repeat-associated protein